MLTTADHPVLFKTKNVRITPLLVRIGRASYPIANLTSVSIRDPRGLTSCYAAGFLLLGLGTGCLLFSTPEHDRGGWALILLFSALIIFSRAVFTRQWLILHTAGDEWRALLGSDETLTQAKQAIEKAINTRG